MPTIADYKKYADLQMAAESMFGIPNTAPPGTPSMVMDSTGLVAGNARASRFTSTQAQDFIDAKWTVVEHISNTTTGFSGTLFRNTQTHELVLSMRSTEFVDDAARDSQATNSVEIYERGFAFGQIADMEAWYTYLKTTYQEAFVKAGGKVAVTGYSLGGHLATAFAQLRMDAGRFDTEISGVYTFNGAGIGDVAQGSLTHVIEAFRQRVKFGNSDLFTRQETISFYQEHRGFFATGNEVTSTQVAVAIAELNNAIADADPVKRADGARLRELTVLKHAFTRIQEVVAESERIGPGFSSGNPDVQPPKKIETSKIAAIGLDYQLAVYKAGQMTESHGFWNGLVKAIDNGSRTTANLPRIYDIYGDTAFSMVANSQQHLGASTPIWIEDQPEARGNIKWATVKASSAEGGTKLLAPNFGINDFGDTHSLVLLVDSLAVQEAFEKLSPGINASTAKSILTIAANGKVKTGFTTNVGLNNQGLADGEPLENVVNALGRLLGRGWAETDRLKGSNTGGTWADIDDRADGTDGRADFHARLKDIVTSQGFKDLAGNATIKSAAGADLLPQARTNFGTFLSLESLSPFVLETNATGEAALKQARADLAQLWEADRTLTQAQRDSGLQNFSDMYLQQRQSMLAMLTTRNSINESDVTLRVNADPVLFEDAASGVSFRVSGPGAQPSARKVSFGNGQANSIVGSDDAATTTGDRLFGGGGADTLDGKAGDDWLEGGSEADILLGGAGSDTLFGNTGDDTLNGGKGADILKGGAGFDTYVLHGGDGSGDTIIDRDGRIKVIDSSGSEFVLDNLTLIRDTSTRWHSNDGRFVFAATAQADGKLTLLITGRGVQVTVKDFQSGDLGITLPGSTQPQPTPITNRTILGDLQPAEPPEYDDLGNLVVTSTAQPGREDVLYDGGGDELIQSFAGNDHITLNLGGTNWVQAGEGNDFVSGGPGADIIEGGAGRDVLFGRGGDDRLWARERADLSTILEQTEGAPNSEADLVSGTAGNDLVVGWSGNDALLGGGGHDVMVGGAGDDNILGDRVAGEVNLETWSISRQVTTDGQGNVTERTLTPTGFLFLQDESPDHDLVMAGAGADWVLTEAGEDYIDGGSGADYLVGGTEGDAIVGADGADEILGDGDSTSASLPWYADPALHGNDYLDGGAGNDKLIGGGRDDNLRGGDDNDLMFGDANSLAVQYHGADFLFGEAGDDDMIGGGGEDVLYGGDGIDRMDGDSGLLAGASHGKDRLYGENGNDIMIGAGSDDFLSGGADNDVMYGDAIGLAGEFHGADRLEGDDGIDELHGQGGGDILLGGAGADQLFGDSSEVAVQYHGEDYLDGGEGNDLLRGYGGNDMLRGGAGADQLAGEAGNDILEGGTGVDLLEGGAGDDTYVFNVGDANNPGTAEVIVDDEGVNHIELNGMSLSGLSLLPTQSTETLVIQAGSDNVYVSGFQSGKFGSVTVSGTTYTASEFFGKTFVYEIQDTNNLPNSSLQGGRSDDTLTANGGGSTLAGGSGNDSLNASGGGNTFLYASGDGSDTITDSSAASASDSTLRFGRGIVASDIRLSRDGDHLVLNVGEASVGQVRIAGFNAANALAAGNVSRFEFEDGTVLTYAQLLERGFDIEGTSGADTLLGTNLADRLSGKQGNDSLGGGAGADTYEFGGDNGIDVIADGDATQGGGDRLLVGMTITPLDVTVSRLGYDLTLTFGSNATTLKDYFRTTADTVELIEFEDGTIWTPADVLALLPLASEGDDTIAGDDTDNALDGLGGNDVIAGLGGNDTLTGGTGNDQLDGGTGNDVFEFRLGDGADVVVDTAGLDTLSFASGIDGSSLVLQDTGDDLRIVVGAGGDSVTLPGYLRASPNEGLVEQVRFSSGTTWTQTDLLNLRLAGTAGADSITGFNRADVIDGLAGADTIFGRGGDDQLRGGTGADVLYGGLGNDTYQYLPGDGADTVDDADPTQGSGGLDTLFLGGTINPTAVLLQRSGDNLVVNTGSAGDVVTIGGYYSRGDFEQIRFASGTVWTQTDIAAKAPMNGTAGADTLTGTAAADLMDGGAGADTLRGAGGDDILRGGTDPARKINYQDALYGEGGNDQLFVGSAPTQMWGGDGNDILVGGARMDGGSGNNLFVGSASVFNDMYFDATTHNILIGGKGDDGFEAFNARTSPSPIGRNLYLYNAGDGVDGLGDLYVDRHHVILNDVLSLGQIPYSKLTLSGGIGFTQVQLAIGRNPIWLSEYDPSPLYPTGNAVKYLQIIVAASDYNAASTDPLRNKKVVLIDYEAFAAEFYATATTTKGYDVQAGLRRHIVSSSDTEAMGGKIAYEYARVGNIDSVTVAERFAILSDPNLNLVGQPISGAQGGQALAMTALPEDSMVELVGVSVEPDAVHVM